MSIILKVHRHRKEYLVMQRIKKRKGGILAVCMTALVAMLLACGLASTAPTQAFAADAYLTVIHKQKTADGGEEELGRQTMTEEEFNALVVTDGDPVSNIVSTMRGVQVATAATYVPLDSLFDYAKLSVADDATVVFQSAYDENDPNAKVFSSQFTWGDMKKGVFYPNTDASATITDTTGAVKVEPVLGVKAGKSSIGTTAADAVKANLANADTSMAPINLQGMLPDATELPGGKTAMTQNIATVTVIDPVPAEPAYLTVHATAADGSGEKTVELTEDQFNSLVVTDGDPVSNLVNTTHGGVRVYTAVTYVPLTSLFDYAKIPVTDDTTMVFQSGVNSHDPNAKVFSTGELVWGDMKNGLFYPNTDASVTITDTAGAVKVEPVIGVKGNRSTIETTASAAEQVNIAKADTSEAPGNIQGMAPGVMEIPDGSAVRCRQINVIQVTVPTFNTAKPAPTTKPTTEPTTKPASEPAAQKAHWVKSNGKWWYEEADGSWPANTWKRIGGQWYYFDKAGWALTDWQKIGGSWYYFNTASDKGTECAAATGWKSLDGEWYYFNTASDKGTECAMRSGWLLNGGDWYLLSANHDGTFGAMLDGWQKVGGEWYYLTPGNGSMKTGWYQVGNTWYYSYSSGVMAASTVVDGYYVNASGAWVR
ncbi:hypothetical protein GMI68_05835 [Eggerthellaceae bacterium zg-886]|uniref:Uncharacterized protein n=2 Tax=Xiamenia xianingshaonis TaxID=2682776 RepID=A0ABX0IHH2_9ACTN|nr:hypothetical protein [Xiamenia xianingshaonis]